MSGSRVSSDGFEWSCPFCGQSRLNVSEDGSGNENAVSALRSHILASEGSGHGAVNAYPPEFDPETLADHVDRLDRRERPVDPDG